MIFVLKYLQVIYKNTTYINFDLPYNFSPIRHCFFHHLQVIYENTAYSEFDRPYVGAVVRNILHNIYTDSSGTLVLGSVAVPTPPANVGTFVC